MGLNLLLKVASTPSYRGHRWPGSAQDRFGVIRGTSLETVSNSKNVGRRAKLTVIHYSGTLIKEIAGTFDLLVFIVIANSAFGILLTL